MTIEAIAAPTDAVQTQNLFEHAAAHAQGLSQGAGPQQLGGEVMQNLQGYIERSGSLAERTRALSEQPMGNALVSLPSGPAPALPAQPDAPPVNESQMDRAIQSLGLMFDHAIETQLVVRGATQVSGAANTLLRGQ
ncbi:hypothetical protein QCN27_06890 [Cereibacter sp. SYSU M97828]|nr:hypothetical protein [Cereibacter flavus]